MKKIVLMLLALVLAMTGTACGKQPPSNDVEPQISQMRSICELAVMDCYYHNVAKYKEEDAEGILWWKKDKHFWIEYSGVVRLGIDASLVTIKVEDTNVTITIPEATVQSCKVDSSSLTEDSYIVAKDSADIDADDETFAFEEAQLRLEENAASDKTLLAQAQQRAQALLEDYVTNIGSAVGKNYSIQWVYLDAEGQTLGTSSSESSSTGADSSTQSSQIEGSEAT